MTSPSYHWLRPGDQPGDALERLQSRPPAPRLRDLATHASTYTPDASLLAAIDTALTLSAPLLVTGEPGTGKTQVAYFIAAHFGIKTLPFTVRSTSNLRDLEYDFDAVGYLRTAQDKDEAQRQLPREHFLTRGPLWEALESQEEVVLLIDEIDKSPRDFPNDLLLQLDQGWFPHPFTKEKVGDPAAPLKPIVVLTSNAERRLPDAFLRRCVFHHIQLTRELVQRAMDARADGFPNLDADSRERALDVFWKLRTDEDIRKAPSTGELLLWLAVLSAKKVRASDLDPEDLDGLPALGVLIKDEQDYKRFSQN